MKKAITSIIIIVIILVVASLYLTRSASAPSQTTDSVVSGEQTASTSEKVYRISTSTSMVKFSIGEILNGKPFTAVGTTSDIAGEIRVGDTVAIGKIAVNGRTFKTDSSRRDGAISRFIIKAEDPANEFIVFEPTSMSTSTLSGNLTFAGVTKPVTFNTNIVVGETSVKATATVKLKRADWGLVIPNVSFVASVDEEFTVTVDVVADLVS